MYEKHTLLTISEYKILELFLDMKRHYYAEISKKTELTRPRTMRALRKLEKANVLKTDKEANIKYYSISKNPFVYAILSIVEYCKSMYFLEKNTVLKRALDMFYTNYKDYLIALIFGSYAKGIATRHSDIDLLLVKEDFSKSEIKKIEELVDIINGRTGLKISPYLIKANELKQKKDFVKEIIENHIMLSGSEIFFRMVLE